MKIEQVQSTRDLHAFLTGECGFVVKAGFDPVPETDRTVYVVNDSDDTMEVIMIGEASSGVMDDLLKEMTVESPVEQYQMIVQDDFQKVGIQRAKSPPSWGIKSRYRIVYDAASSKEDTKKSLLAKINGLRYETGNDQKAFHDLFDVKEIVDKFYIDYEKFRAKLAANITFSKGFEVSDDDRDEYATIVMNRIVFTYFIQVPSKGTSIIPGRFIQDLYARYHETKNVPSFYHCLCKLWFEYFNDDKPRSGADGIFECIPYLNGGLFSHVDGIEIDVTTIIYKEIQIPDKIWDDLFTIFESYEWTVVENDEDDDLLGITPSILGHIYEKSCNQKESGSYYTPDTITNYISKECISKHVTGKVNTKFKKNYINFVDEVIGKEKLDHDELRELDWAYNNVITNITICDNACGSGAFLIAAEKILVDIYQRCLKWIDKDDVQDGIPFDKEDIYAIKRYIVTNNIYGVDIQEGSVEIAKLRLWLSMISSMQGGNVEPLPNIDYNILDGNSLLGFVKMPTQWGNSLLSNPDILKELLKENEDAKREYKVTKNASRSFTLRQEIDDGNAKIRAELDSLYLKKINTIKNINATKTILEKIQPFHWCFEFQEIFDKGGFDIIIGNPPYVRQEVVKHFIEGFDYKGVLKNSYNHLVKDPIDKKIKLGGTVDLSMYFILRSHQHVKQGGIFSYIITTKWLRSRYGKPVRHFLKNKTTINAIRDLTGKKVFRGVGVDTLIYNITKSTPKKGSMISYNEPASIDDMESGKYDCLQEKLDDDSWVFIPKESMEIKEWIERIGDSLNKLGFDINFGIKSGKGEVFIIEREKYNELINLDKKNQDILKPLLSGKDISPYNKKWDEKWLIYIPWHFPRDPLTNTGVLDEIEKEFENKYPKIYEYLKSNKNLLLTRNKTETGIRYEWYALSRFGSTYYKNFSLPKIVFTDIAKEPSFCIDLHGIYISDSVNQIVCSKKIKIVDLLHLCLVLNSTTIFYHFKQFASKLGKQGYRFKPFKVRDMSIIMSRNHPTLFTRLSEIIHYAVARDSSRVPFLKAVANALVQDLYFHAKFHADGIYPDDKEWLGGLLEPLVHPIQFERWDALDWKREKGEITEDESKELERLIEENDTVIENVVNAIKDSKEVEDVMNIISNHPWVKIIEKETKVE